MEWLWRQPRQQRGVVGRLVRRREMASCVDLGACSALALVMSGWIGVRPRAESWPVSGHVFFSSCNYQILHACTLRPPGEQKKLGTEQGPG